MSGNETNEVASGEEPSALTPSISKVPKGGSKIFILTPEILKSLGITSHAGIKRTASKSTTNDDIGNSTASRTSEVGPKGSNHKSKRVGAKTNKCEAQKRKRSSPSAGRSNKKEKNLKSPTGQPSENRTKGKTENNSSHSYKSVQEESYFSTPKTKKTSRKSGTRCLNDEQGDRKKSGKESKEDIKEKSEKPASSSRTSRRVVKPKKFDDYVVTDDYFGKIFPKDNFVFTPPAAKRESRKSSLNSKNVEPVAGISENVVTTSKEESSTGKTTVDRVENEKTVKNTENVEEVKQRRSSLDKPRSKSTDKTYPAVSETLTSCRTPRKVKTYERRDSHEQRKADDEKTKTEAASRKNAEKSAVKLINSMHTYACPKKNENLDQKSINETGNSKTEKLREPVISKEPVNPELCKDQSVLNENEKKEASAPLLENRKKSLDKFASAEEKESETGETVSEIKTNPSELCSSEKSLDPAVVESAIILPAPPIETNETEKIVISKPKPLKIPHARDDNPAKPSYPESRTKNESSSSKTHLPRSPDDKETNSSSGKMAENSRENSATCASIPKDKKETVRPSESQEKRSTSKSEPAKSKDNKKEEKAYRTLTLVPIKFEPKKNLKPPLKKEVTSKTENSQSVNAKEARSSKLKESTSRPGDKSKNSKLPSPKVGNKNETIVLKPNTSENANAKKVIDPNLEPVTANTNTVIPNSHSPRVEDKTQTSIPLGNSSEILNKDELVSKSKKSAKPHKTVSMPSKLNAPISRNKNEESDRKKRVDPKLDVEKRANKGRNRSLENCEASREKNDIPKVDSTRKSSEENKTRSVKTTLKSADHQDSSFHLSNIVNASEEEVTTVSMVEPKPKISISLKETQVVDGKSNSCCFHENAIKPLDSCKSEFPDVRNEQNVSKQSTETEKVSTIPSSEIASTRNSSTEVSGSPGRQIASPIIPVPEGIERLNDSSQTERDPEENENPEEPKVSRKRGRPRRSVIPSGAPVEKKAKVEDASMPDGETPEAVPENVSRVKKPVKRDENEIDGKGLSEGSEDEGAMEETVTRRIRGRPTGSMSASRGRGRRRGRGRGRGRGRVDFEYVPRERSSQDQGTNAEKEENSTVVDGQQQSETIIPVGEVECGKCKQKMSKKSWPHHNLKTHNDMGWLSGEPEPDFTDEKFLRSLLAAVVRKKKGKGVFTCELCGNTKRSPFGFISHLQFCGKTEDEKAALLVHCPICGNIMMSSSWPMHERYHRQLEKVKEDMKTDSDVNSAPHKEKRKAAERAATKITEFTDLIKGDEPPAKKQKLNNEQCSRFISRPRDTTRNPPNRWRGIWKTELSSKGKTRCRQPGCTFVTDTLESMFEHNSSCPCVPRTNYSCRICKYFHESEKEVLKHIKSNHAEGKTTQADSDFEQDDSSSSSDDDFEGSDEKISKSSPTPYRPGYGRHQRPITHVDFLDNEPSVERKRHFTPAIRWTMEFERKNYRLSLFENLLPNPMKRLSDQDAQDYLPKVERSMRVRGTKKAGHKESAVWTSWERFQGRIHDGVPTLFTGGPVWAIAWLTIPAPMFDQKVDQYVAISTHPTMESSYTVGQSHAEKNLLQIWNMGPMDHRKNDRRPEPRIAYGVAHNKGTIWCLEWCPSGCYEHPSFLNEEEQHDRPKRMGLLAAACSDGCVHIFSLPFSTDLNSGDNDEMPFGLPIYETKPVLTLLTNTAMYEKGEQSWQCTKLNWGKQLGHDTVIAGYSNGYVALWNLNTESPLFVTKRGETTLIDAHHHFFAHGHAISFVHLIPYGDKRFCISSSYDRFTKVWDLEDTSYPLSTIKRGIAMDGAWLTHWPGYFTAYDDVMVHGHTYYVLLRQSAIKMFPLLPSNSATFSLDASDYGNALGHGTMGGEVLVMFPHHLWSIRDMERDLPNKRWLASSTEVVDFEPPQVEKPQKSKSAKKETEYVYMPETYEGCKDRFGIAFQNHLSRERVGPRSTRPCAERLAPVKIERYPFTSVNRISWNPNPWSYLWMCVGYQNGLVRFLNFNAVDVEKEWSKLLPTHAKSMLDQRRKELESEIQNSSNSNSSRTSDQPDS